jgi:drug/metabolite transporter (DMT)-like permease
MLEENEIRVSERSIPHRKSLSLFWGTTTSTARQYRSRHRKNKSSISDLYHAIKDYDLAPIREDFHRTSLEVKKQFVRELQEMNRGQVAFFDMSMTRSLSVLPDDIPYLAHETISSTTPSETPSESASTSLENKQQGPNIGHYLALFLAVFAVSSKSTGFHLLDHVKAPLKQYWKMTATSVGLFPFALVAIQKDGIRSLTLSQWLTFVAAIVCYSIQNVLFVKSLEFTTVGNACIYANSQALLLIVGKACVGDKIHWMEGIGVMIAFSGAILCTKDAEEQSSRDMDSSTNGKFGDVLALMSAVAGVFYLTFAKAVRSGISVSTFVFGVMFFGQFFILTFLQLTSGDTLEYNLNMYDGVFGWLNMHRLPIMIYMVAVVNMVGTMGFVRGTSINYFVLIHLISFTSNRISILKQRWNILIT